MKSYEYIHTHRDRQYFHINMDITKQLLIEAELTFHKWIAPSAAKWAQPAFFQVIGARPR
jgi:hypothetical protein